jgi:GTP-binding protein HflX
VSGLNGDGLELLLSAISARLALEIVETTLKLPLGQGKLRAQLFELSAVVSESVDDDGRQCLQVRLEANSLRKLISQAGLEFADLGIADSRDDQEPWMKNVVNS